MITAEQNRVESKPTAGVGDASASYHVGLFDVWGLVRRRKGLFLFGLVAGLGLACLYYFQATPVYESEVEILVMRKDSRLPTKGTEGGADFERQSMDEDLLSTHVQLFRSPRIVKQAIQNNNLRCLPTVAKQIREDKDPAKYIIDQLQVTKGGAGRAKDAHVLRGTFRGPSPEDCAAVLNALVESYQDFLGKTFQDTSSEAMELISQAKVKLGEELTQAETDYRKFREGAPLLWKGQESSNLHQERLAEIEKSLSEIRAQRTETKARLDVIEEALGGKDASNYADLDMLSLLDDKDVQRLSLLLTVTKGDATSEAFLASQPLRDETARTEYQRLLSLMLQEETLLEDFGPDHPRVQTVQKQIKLTREFLDKNAPTLATEQKTMPKPADLLKAHVGLLRHDLSELQKRQAALEEAARVEEEAARKLVSYELQEETMRSGITRMKDLHDAVVERLREINLIKDYGGYLTEVISPVEQAKQPVAPVLVLVLGLGGVLGLFFGAGLAYVADLADRTFRSPEEIRQALRLPIMGHVPRLAARNGKVPTSGDGKQPIDWTLVPYHRPRSREAETIRGLRTALYFSTYGAGHKVIQITSPNPKDGKTMLTANLAVSMAQSGKNVLVVDCDFRHPKIHKLFAIEREVGLSNVIAEQAELPDAVQNTRIGGLSILPCGSRPPNPSELLTSPRFEQFITLVREQYDFVLIDSPPLLAVSDPAVIAPRADGVLLAIRVAKNGRPHAIQAREILADLGVDVLGVVVNGMNQDRNYGYGYYGGKYGYGGTYGYGYAGNGRYYEEEDQEQETADPVGGPTTG